MLRTNGVHIGVLGLALFLGVGAWVSHAKPLDDTNKIGSMGNLASVDIDRLYNASGGPEELDQKEEELTQDMEMRLKKIVESPYLSGMELQEFAVLVGKFAPNPAEQERTKALQGISEKNALELKALSAKKEAELTPQDKARQRQILEFEALLQRVLPTLQAGMASQREVRLGAFRREQLSRLRKLVDDVAKPKGLNVFDTSVLVSSPNDITPQILQRLPKRK